VTPILRDGKTHTVSVTPLLRDGKTHTVSVTPNEVKK
jgi:hypothetical protein